MRNFPRVIENKSLGHSNRVIVPDPHNLQNYNNAKWPRGACRNYSRHQVFLKGSDPSVRPERSRMRRLDFFLLSVPCATLLCHTLHAKNAVMKPIGNCHEVAEQLYYISRDHLHGNIYSLESRVGDNLGPRFKICPPV